MIPDPWLWPALVAAGFGAILDVKERRLPNWLCAVLAAASAGGLALTEGASAVPSALLHASIALIVGMALFRTSVIGGGDAKFYAAAACALPLGSAHYLLGWTSAAGLALLVVMAVGRRFLPSSRGTPILRGWDVPYGVAIFAGFSLAAMRGTPLFWS
jgi:prepilin peptidase CpaA